ncbi:hypothetical protein C900_02650 [Fulvivirga imtechensis AK7]|uniref:Uncharacterized protein n=1 Tax=Fulvivirga imtechensis AK7 TaxID=1237149 RepID=L8JXQ6_9BACT|nr:hypothetical protein C900_02650 [Fulvivirga imtechensis AK7]
MLKKGQSSCLSRTCLGEAANNFLVDVVYNDSYLNGLEEMAQEKSPFFGFSFAFGGVSLRLITLLSRAPEQVP